MTLRFISICKRSPFTYRSLFTYSFSFKSNELYEYAIANKFAILLTCYRPIYFALPVGEQGVWAPLFGRRHVSERKPWAVINPTSISSKHFIHKSNFYLRRVHFNK